MESNRTKDLNLLGHKRNEEKFSNEGQLNNIKQQKSNDTKNQKLSLKRPQFFNSFQSQDNNINLDEKNDEIDMNKSTNGENIIKNSICEKCGNRSGVLIFSNFKNILQYFSKKNILLLFEINELAQKYENFEFEKPKIICSDCLLRISSNKMEFENFITVSNEINDYPFNNLFQNSYLKNFNNKETKKNNKTMQPSLNDINKKILEMFGQNEKLNIFPPINNISNNNGTPNLNYLNLECLNHLNSFLPCVNYNMPFNQNISNLNIPNYFNINNDLNSLFSLNNILKNPEIKENNNNINNLNYPLFLTNNLLNPPLSILSQDLNNISNINQSTSLNKDNSMEKNNDINPNLSSTSENNKTISDNNKKNDDINYIHKEKNNEKEIQNNANKNYIVIQNKDFEEIFNLVSQLYNKLINVKSSQKSVLNHINSNNIKGKNINSINLDLNRVNNSKKDNCFNDFLLNAGNLNYNNNLYSNSNTVNNSNNISNIHEPNKNNQTKVKEINSIYNINENLNGNKKESIK